MTETTLEVICHTFSCAPNIGGIIHSKLKHKVFSERSTILFKTERSESIYLMLAGKSHAVTYSVEGNLLLLYVFKIGDLFGENAIFDSIGANHEIIAVEEVKTGVFSAAAFLGLMENYNCVALSVSRMLTERLSLTTRRMIEMSTLSAIGRIYAELLRQARATPDLTLRPAPVLSEFALQVHSTRETVSRAINELERRGIIRRSPAELKIVAAHRLEELIV